MDTRPSKKPPTPNKLVLPSLVMACVSAMSAPFALIATAAPVYLFFVLPLGIVAAILARIAISQIKRGAGTRQEHNLAVAAYFLGLAPALYLCGMLSYDLFRM